MAGGSDNENLPFNYDSIVWSMEEHMTMKP